MTATGIVLAKPLRDAVTVARFRLYHQSRERTWFVTASATGFFMVAPLVLLGQTIVGRDGERLGPFSELSGYDNYTGFLAVPLVFAFLTNSAYSWIGQTIRQEQMGGTLERTLMSMRFPASLILGGAMAHLFFLAFYIAVGIASVALIADLQLDINWWTAMLAAVAHLYAVYGFAFVLSSLFLWIRDAFIVQQTISYVAIPLLAGAGFPIEIYPGWLQAVAKAIPFTWAFQLERQAFLKHAGIDEMAFGLIVITAISTGLWALAFVLFRLTLRRARRTGALGMY
jgi:ABC-2 type transport system permease protein